MSALIWSFLTLSWTRGHTSRAYITNNLKARASAAAHSVFVALSADTECCTGDLTSTSFTGWPSECFFVSVFSTAAALRASLHLH